LKITKCVQIQFGNWEGHVQINQIHETLPVERSWFTCQFLYAGKDLPGGDSLLSNERAISRRDTVVPIIAVRAASDARRLRRGEVAEECKTIFWRSGFDPENPSAGIRMVTNPETIWCLMSSHATLQGSVHAVILRRKRNLSLAAIVNLNNIWAVSKKMRAERSRFAPSLGGKIWEYGQHILSVSNVARISHCKEKRARSMPVCQKFSIFVWFHSK
jgi:hypothetical protein